MERKSYELLQRMAVMYKKGSRRATNFTYLIHNQQNGSYIADCTAAMQYSIENMENNKSML